ncbi:MAG: hypothetical protein K8L91_31495 [Anaerolineae bacterium]|nr:hypothetical protein [Anaerolineae bacterium]
MTPKRQTQIAGYIGSLFIIAPIFVPSLREYSLWLTALGVFIIAIPQFAQTRQSFKLVNEAEDRRDEDVTLENYQPTRNAALLINQLAELGFTRLGETRSPLKGHKNPITWILSNPDHTDFAEVIDLQGKLPAMLQFTTVFANEAVLETAYPIGENKDFPQHRFRFNSVSVPSAYEQHSLDRFRLESQHGAPRPFRTMVEHLAWEGRYRELYGRNKLRGSEIRSLMYSLFILAMLGSIITYALANSDFISEDLSWTLACVLVAAGMLAGLVGFIMSIPVNSRIALAQRFKKSQDKATRPRRRIFGR